MEPSSNEQARADYLEKQMQGMNSVRLPSSMPSLEDGISVEPESLSKRIQSYCQEKKDSREHGWETHKLPLNRIRENKDKQYQQ